jgi:hypothetical protein
VGRRAVGPRLVEAGAAGVVVAEGHGRLELLAATIEAGQRSLAHSTTR